MHLSSFGLGMAGSGGSVLAKNILTSAVPALIGAGISNQMNCILKLFIPSATKIADSGNGSLEYTSGELQTDRNRIEVAERKINIVFFSILSTTSLSTKPWHACPTACDIQMSVEPGRSHHQDCYPLLCSINLNHLPLSGLYSRIPDPFYLITFLFTRPGRHGHPQHQQRLRAI